MVLFISQDVVDTVQAHLGKDEYVAGWQALADAGDRYAQVATHVLSKEPSLMNCFRAAHWNYATGRDYANDDLWPDIAKFSLQKYIGIIESSPKNAGIDQMQYQLPNTQQIESCYIAGVKEFGLQRSSIIHLCGNQIGHRLNKVFESACHGVAPYAGPLKSKLEAVDMPDWHEVVGLSFESLGERGIDNSENITELSYMQNLLIFTKSLLKGVATYAAIKAGLSDPANYGLVYPTKNYGK